MSVLSESDIKRIREECEFHFNHDSIAFGLAVAAAAIAADRAARGLPVAWQLLSTEIITHEGDLLSDAVFRDCWRPLYADHPSAPVAPDTGLLLKVASPWKQGEVVTDEREDAIKELRAMLADAPAPSKDNGVVA